MMKALDYKNDNLVMPHNIDDVKFIPLYLQ